MFQVAYLLASGPIGSLLGKLGRKNFIMMGYTLIILATAGFGFMAYIKDG